jgi:hypothetical protein
MNGSSDVFAQSGMASIRDSASILTTTIPGGCAKEIASLAVVCGTIDGRFHFSEAVNSFFGGNSPGCG